MVPNTIRKAIGVVKDKTSISIAKVASNLDPELEILIVKATSHDDDMPNHKYLEEIMHRTSSSRPLVNACVSLISKRIGRTHDWIVALKSLILVHRLMLDGGKIFLEEIAKANASSREKVGMLGNLCEFKDQAHFNSSDYSEFVRHYGMYLDEKVDSMVFDKMWLRKKVASCDDQDDSTVLEANESKIEGTNLSEMSTEKVLIKMEMFQSLLHRVLACRPKYMSKLHKIVLLALFPVVEESISLYSDICEGLSVLLDRFWDMEYKNSAKAFGAYVTVAKQIDELVEFYAWCKGVGVARRLDYPQVARVSDDYLRSLEDFLKSKGKNSKNTKINKSESSLSVVKTRALPIIHEHNAEEPTIAIWNHEPEDKPRLVTEDLINLKDGEALAEEQGNKVALALFSEGPTTVISTQWEEFSDSDKPNIITSAWEVPAPEINNADWEVALVESASNLAKKNSELSGHFDGLILSDMYYQGAASNNASCTQLSSGSASSENASLLPEKSENAILALPCLEAERQVHMVKEDPFAASLAMPSPPFVQIAEMEQKRELMAQEHQLWQQYGVDGMQGQVGLLQNGSSYHAIVPPATTPYGTRNKVGLPGWY